jgi:LmbE family N-acetylglucosaminyl deacetylase
MRYAVQPEIVSCPRGRRLLVLAPHQDDEIIGCGGVFQNSIKAGKEVQVIYLTDGAPPKMRGGERERYIKVRQDEARRVWEAMGGREPIFWDFPCRRLPLNEVAVDKIAGAIDDFKPDCLFIPFFLEGPDDHRKVPHLLWLVNEKYPMPNLEVWGYQITVILCPNVAVDISGVEERKYEIMHMWESQNMEYDYGHRARGMNAVNAMHVQGILKGNPRAYVELFLVLPMNEYADLAAHYFKDAPQEELYDIVV